VCTTGPNAEAVRKELERVLSSGAFVRNERQSQFLRFLVERHLQGRDVELKESVIGVEVFGRRADYDPKLDAIVRTEAVRLRARLQKFYASEGSGNPVIIELPKGAYRPLFREQATVPELPHSRPPHRWWWLAGAVGLLIAVTTGDTWWRGVHTDRSFTIAVLPLENVTHDSGSDYFADGLTDEIIRSLSTIDGLTVRSRTSSFALKGKRLNAGDAGRQLVADYLVEGSVMQAGQQLRINAELVRVGDDTPVWSGRYDRELTDLFATQDEISRGIVNSLRLKLGPGRRRYETNLEAYDLYLRGRHAMEGFPAVGRNIARDAVQFFEQAIDKDANFAIAYAGEADALLAIDQNLVNPEAYRRARIAAEKAVELDPMLSEAQSALASIRAREYDWQDAERRFRRAIDLNPNNALAHLQLGFSVLVVQGRFDEGLEEVRRAVSLDPLSPYINTEFGRALLWAGRYREAVGQLRKAIALDASRARPYDALGRALALDGKFDEALAIFTERDKRGAGVGAGRVCVLARAGRLTQARALLQQQISQSNRGPFNASTLESGDLTIPAGRSATVERGVAQTYACLGDEAQALGYMEKALAQNEPGLAEMVQAPELAWTRANPHFAALRRKLNLPS